jgi:hypothetical protein
VIRRGGINDAVQAILANRNTAKPVETIVLSSTHRVAEKVSEKLHEVYKKARPELTMAQIAAFKPKELQPAELLSTASYKPGEMIEYQPDGQRPVRMAEVLEVTAQGVQVKGQLKGAQELVSFDMVAAVFERTTLGTRAGRGAAVDAEDQGRWEGVRERLAANDRRDRRRENSVRVGA